VSSSLAALLERYAPLTLLERHEVGRLSAATDWDRSTPVHATASAFVVHRASRRVLLRWHERQQAWIQVGGHADPGETDALAIALREAEEETGLTDLVAVSKEPIQITVVPVPANHIEPAHEHADIRFVFATDRPDDIRAENDSAHLRWLSIEEAIGLTTEENVREALRRVGTLIDDWTMTPITPSFGAELTGAQITSELDAGWLRSMLDAHRVLVFRGQQLSRAEQVAFGRMLGELTPAHPVVPGDPAFPEILELDGAKGGKNARWHTDVTFVATPPAASVLVAELVPNVGGDTQWADLCAAYESLSAPMRALVEQLEAVHRISPLAYWGEPFDTALTRDDAMALYEQSLTVPPVIHPVVRVHPRTGRKALFVNPGFTTHLIGMSRTESNHLLALLYEHMARPEVVMRHRWRPGDVLIWDNQATMHYAIDDYDTTPRRMRRVTVRGRAPVGTTGVESRIATDPLVAVR
jgi:alpha-ketoglutarate-dependent taurine dioxygenase/8-oxo-dGTP pyrophosphatase MutT (NUDIX family)